MRGDMVDDGDGAPLEDGRGVAIDAVARPVDEAVREERPECT